MTHQHTPVPDLVCGDIVYFDYLHLHTARRSEKQSHKKQHFFYELEGKARPALVVNGPSISYGAKWYQIYHLTATGPVENEKTKSGYTRIGPIINSEKESFICHEPERYPDNLVSGTDRGKYFVKRLDPSEYSAVLKIVQAGARSTSNS